MSEGRDSKASEEKKLPASTGAMLLREHTSDLMLAKKAELDGKLLAIQPKELFGEKLEALLSILDLPYIQSAPQNRPKMTPEPIGSIFRASMDKAAKKESIDPELKAHLLQCLNEVQIMPEWDVATAQRHILLNIYESVIRETVRMRKLKAKAENIAASSVEVEESTLSSNRRMAMQSCFINANTVLLSRLIAALCTKINTSSTMTQLF
eukprot:jgi/Bigna1/134569/aug1.25_g9277